ncbi:helix-turn-helix transcriptional regulator [Bosea sp. FBZP-16]|uniref:helix-turn-helix domain-containing protein n=1 Tax=Bosea sp. FBZP-16 TaxID=2065382 RepID=UPI000C310579|nr:helix-turn-helix transcriptional regulator [Bosea sp. FBZP-16]
MSMNFGELIRYVREVRGMESTELAAAVGLSQGRIYQVETNQGGLPRNWWKIVDALRIPRATAIKSMPRAMALSALAALERAGEPNPLKTEGQIEVLLAGADTFDVNSFIDPDDVKLPNWKPSPTDSARAENKPSASASKNKL